MPENIAKIIEGLKKEIGETTAVVWAKDPFRVLISTVLSQRTKDENTAKAMQSLYKRYNTPKKLANAPLKEVESLIYGSGFYRVKAKRVKEISKILVEKYNSKVPNKIDELLKLPGVGRKTANCVLCFGFNIPAIPVDTHVHRISNRIGIVKAKNPDETEEELQKILPKEYWLDYNELMVKFGQRICRPIKPPCYECPIVNLCKYPDKK